MEVVLFTLVLYINDVPKEWMAHWEDPVTKEWTQMGLSGCLWQRRNISRLSGFQNTRGGRYACEQRRVTTRANWEGRTVIDKLGEKV